MLIKKKILYLQYAAQQGKIARWVDDFQKVSFSAKSPLSNYKVLF